MKKLKIIDWYIISLLVAGVSAVILRSYALLHNFNRITMYFENNTASLVGNLIAVAGVLLFMSYLFLGEKDYELIARTDNAATFIPSGLVCVATLFMAMERFQSIPEKTANNQLLRTICIITPILALLSVASFFISIFMDKKYSGYKAIFNLSTVFFFALYASILFFDTDMFPTNAPTRVVDEMAYLFSAVFFLYETRIHLGRAKWRFYVSFGLSATLLCLFSAIPSIVVYIIDGYTVSESITESVLTLTLAIFIASRVFQSRNLTPNAECDAAKSISALAAFREEQMEEQKKLSRAQEDNKVENEATQDASNYTFDIPYVDPSVEFNPDGADIDLNGDYDE